MTRRMSRQVGLSATFLALVAGGTAACDDGGGEDEYRQEERVYHCAVELPDGQERVVDCDDVDEDDGGGAFVYVGGAYQPVFIHSAPAGQVRAHAPGQVLPRGTGARIGYTDADGRARAGLPPRGGFTPGTVKTSVVGKGGAPAPAGAKAGG